MKNTIGVRIPSEVEEALRAAAKQQNRTLSNMAGQALVEWATARGLLGKKVVTVGTSG